MATPDWRVEQGHGCPASAPWAVVDSDSGEVYCCSRSEADARAQAAVAWDADTAGDAADSGAIKEGVVPGGRSSTDGDRESRATPSDIHAGSANKADIAFLHDVAGHVVGSLHSAKAVQSKGVHPEVAALAANVLTTRGHDMTAITNLQRRIGVTPAPAAVAAGAAAATGSAGQGGGNAYGRSVNGGGEERKAATKTPYGNVSYADPGYQSDGVKRYPLDSAAHCKAAWSYINMPKNAAKYSSSQVASIKGRIKSAAKKYGIQISSDRFIERLDIDVVRAVALAPEFRSADGDEYLGELNGHFSTFDNWYQVESKWEGTFLERTARSAFDQTIAEERTNMRVLYDHGFDPTIGNKVLGPIRDLHPDEDGAYYSVPLFDTHYNRELLPGLRAGVYGASMRMRVLGDTWDKKPARSDYNPEGLPERTITQATVPEFGPVTFPANPGASAGVRSMTDYFYDQLRLRDTSAYDTAVRAAGLYVPEMGDDMSEMDNTTDLTGRSDAQSVDGGESETGSGSDHGSTYVDEFYERISRNEQRVRELRHASAYHREA